ncbi:MAG: hypothetical protein ACI4B3_09180 [Prevotella sp.]
MATPIIGLRIAGTKQRQAGFAPLVNVGVLAGGEGDNMDRVTLVAEKPAYIIKHASDYILYQLIDRQVKSFDADAPGVLSIAMTIPSNMQLANNVSPYKLLREVYDNFLVKYMERLSDGRDSFINVDNDSEFFRSILSKYPLEERKSSYVRMNPTGFSGIVCVSAADLEDFFRNTQYKEFATFKDIEVGVNCFGQVTLGLDKLQIPLPPNAYDIWVNGKPVGASMQSPTDSYLATADSANYYSYEGVEFALSELLNAPMNRITKNGALIFLDYQKNRISCDLKKIDIYYNFVYDWTDNVGDAKDKIITFAKRGNVKLYFGSEDISQSLWTNCEIKASEIWGRKVEIKPQTVGNYCLYPLTDVDDVKRQIVTRIIVNLRTIPKVQSAVRTQHPARVTSQPKVNNNIGTEDYYKGVGENSSRMDTPQPYEKKNIDVKSFVLGALLGLFVGLGAWGIYAIVSGEKKISPQPDIALTDSIPDASEPTENSLLSSEGEKKDVEGESEEVKPSEKDLEQEKKKLLAEQNAREAEAKAKARNDILVLVNKKDLLAIRQTIKNSSILSKQEINAVEAVLDMNKYKGTIKKNVEKLLQDKTFKSFEDVLDAQKQIWSIIDKEKEVEINK